VSTGTENVGQIKLDTNLNPETSINIERSASKYPDDGSGKNLFLVADISNGTAGQNMVTAGTQTDGSVVVGETAINQSTYLLETQPAIKFTPGTDGNGATWYLNEGEINGGALDVAHGGTGATTAAAALSNIGAAPASHTHAASDVTSGTLPVARGGTGASTAAKALENLGAMENKPRGIEFSPSSSSNHGGYLDFHYNNSTEDYTARIIEESSGVLRFYADRIIAKGIEQSLVVGRTSTFGESGIASHWTKYSSGEFEYAAYLFPVNNSAYAVKCTNGPVNGFYYGDITLNLPFTSANTDAVIVEPRLAGSGTVFSSAVTSLSSTDFTIRLYTNVSTDAMRCFIYINGRWA
jgi:hypothetical protein